MQIEVRQIAFARIEFEQGYFRERIGSNVFGREVPAVVEDDGHFVGIEDIAPNGEDVTLAGNQDAALIGFESFHAAGAVDLDDLRLDLAGDGRQRRRAVVGPRDAAPGEEANEG